MKCQGTVEICSLHRGLVKSNTSGHLTNFRENYQNVNLLYPGIVNNLLI